MFLFALKYPMASAGFEPANLGSKGQHATCRPPKPISNSFTPDDPRLKSELRNERPDITFQSTFTISVSFFIQKAESALDLERAVDEWSM
jgi:hypothetical protein